MREVLFSFFTLLALQISAEELPVDERIERSNYIKQFIKKDDIGLEIGVFEGAFAYYVLLPAKPKKLYLVDPWVYGRNDLDLKLDRKTVTTNYDKYYQRVRKAFKPFKNVEVIRAKSEDIFYRFTDSYFDYVYIDGEHSYEAVLRDLTNYFPKLKVGGFLLGDDYGWEGVAPAVQKFLKDYEGKVALDDDPYAGRTAGQYAIQKISE
ncbi:MAG: class I SAM-dependent methyltransferase [Simkaniaceae bacterium]|nr:class I SAM-dependent methyltransferase [Simkaniaceae bacterium]